ncbi:unnamed protein product [Amoebophrya sp. A120]|nr:unnamed protein product [Amoebophrya sp. A120]|eukprot:GSA120T00016107001.1
MLYVRQEIIEHGVCNFSEPSWRGTSKYMEKVIAFVEHMVNSVPDVKKTGRISKEKWYEYCQSPKVAQLVQKFPQNVAMSYWVLFSTLGTLNCFKNSGAAGQAGLLGSGSGGSSSSCSSPTQEQQQSINFGSSDLIPESQHHIDIRVIALFLMVQVFPKYKHDFNKQMGKENNGLNNLYNEGTKSPRGSMNPSQSPRYQQASPRSARGADQLFGQSLSGFGNNMQNNHAPPKAVLAFIQHEILPKLICEIFPLHPDIGNSPRHRDANFFTLTSMQTQVLAIILDFRRLDGEQLALSEQHQVAANKLNAPPLHLFFDKLQNDIARKCQKQNYRQFTDELKKQVQTCEKSYPSHLGKSLTSDPLMHSIYSQLTSSSASLHQSMGQLQFRNERDRTAGGADSGTPVITRETAVVANQTRSTVIETKCYERVYVVNCRNCHVYLSGGVIGSVYIAGCQDCQIVVSSADLVTACDGEKLSLHVSADLLKLDNCISCTCYLATTHPAIMCGDTRGIKLGPYNVLSHDNVATALDPAVHQHSRNINGSDPDQSFRAATSWSNPLVSGTSSPEEVFSYVHPKDFTPVVIPGISPTQDLATQMKCFAAQASGGGGGEDPVRWVKQLHLPETYSRQLQAKLQDVSQAKQGFDKFKIEKLSENFQQFLNDKNRKKQLQDLAKLQSFAQKQAMKGS